MSKVVNQKSKKWWVKEQVSWKLRNWYRNEVDEEIKRVDSRDKVKHNERSDQLFFRKGDEETNEEMMVLWFLILDQNVWYT